MTGTVQATAFRGDVTGNVSGNAGTVTNGVYTNTSQTISGQKKFNSGAGFSVASATGSLNTLEALGVADQSGSVGAAMMTFHRPGFHAVYLGLDTDNQMKIGGWILGNNAYPILTSGNYNSYAPTLTGTGASGTWGIDITGNAGSASTVADGAITNAKVSGTAAIAGSKINPNFSSAIQINGVQIIRSRPARNFGDAASTVWTESTDSAGFATFPTSTATLDTTKQYVAAIWNIIRYHGLVGRTL